MGRRRNCRQRVNSSPSPARVKPSTMSTLTRMSHLNIPQPNYLTRIRLNINHVPRRVHSHTVNPTSQRLEHQRKQRLQLVNPSSAPLLVFQPSISNFTPFPLHPLLHLVT
uniref:Uncharacterized protein n=1 Tax=Cacopsylla melanoneura TaxID=428564 RepID=A0A8D8S0D3_9HEMI